MSGRRGLRRYPKAPITIANGETHSLPVQGTFINVYSADQDFKIVLDGVEELIMSQNRTYETEIDEQTGRRRRFSQIDVVNDSGNALTFQIEVGDAKIETKDFAINNAVKIRNADSPNDELQIKTKTGTVLKTDDDATQAALATLETAVAAIETMLQNDTAQRAGLTTLAGTSYAASGTTTGVVEVVSAAANTAGVIIRHAQVNAQSHVIRCELLIGGNSLLAPLATSGGSHCEQIQNIFVPAGLQVAFEVVGTPTDGVCGTIFYEVL